VNPADPGSEVPYCAAPDPAPRAPGFAVPALACDTHMHIVGPAARYPYQKNRSYTPPDAPLQRYRALLATLGVARHVVVQPSVYGTDNSRLLDTLAEAGPNTRGVAVIDAKAPDALIERLHAAGVRGARFNFVFPGGVPFGDAETVARRVAPLGWHLDFLLDVSTFEDLERRLSVLATDSVVAHMGHCPTRHGLAHAGRQALLRLLQAGRTWVKLTGGERYTGEREAPYRDVVPVARALVEAAPERCLWGTDWPHVQLPVPMPNDGVLMDQLAVWCPDAEARRAILADNPARLYGF
jgi:predicted TIM-barrel fold metal-dependent hydrolase